jgi:predicted Zn-dependent peptidase
LEDEPGQKAMIELRRRQYPGAWGRPTHGDTVALEALRVDEVRRQYQRGFRPNETILGVAGKLDWARLRDFVGERFGDWPSRAAVPPAAAGELPRRDHVPHESNQTQIGVGYASVPYRHADYFAAWGAVGVLSGGMSSRLFTEVREKRGLCYSVYATYHTLRDAGSVLCYAGTSAERAQETLDVMLAELRRLALGVRDEELQRLKARIKSGLIMQQESSSARSSSIARDWYHLGRVRTLEEVGRLIDDLSCGAINAYLQEHPPRDFTIVTLGPSPLEVPLGVS